MTKTNYDFFFEKLAEFPPEGTIKKGLHYTIDNPKKIAMGVLGLLAASYLLPKLFWASHANQENQMMVDNNTMLGNIAGTNYKMSEILASQRPQPKPEGDKYDYVF